MRKKILAAAAILWLAAGAFAQDPETGKAMTLEEAILQSLKTNLDLAVQVYDPGVAEAQVGTLREVFLPTLAFGYSKDRSERPSTWWLQGALTSINKTGGYTSTLQQLVPTGGRLTLGLAQSTYDSNQPFSTVNPYYFANVQFDFTQPLLKNFGIKTSKHQILVARNNLRLSEDQVRQQVALTIFSVEQAYWDLVFARENLKVSRQSLQLGRDLLAKTRKEVEVGQTAPIESLNAQATVAQREADILAAEAAVRKAQETLASLVNLTSGDGGAPTTLAPSDEPEFKPVEADLDQALQQAMANRPELQLVRTAIDTGRLNFSYARNQLLPQLDLNLSYGSPGMSGDRLLYDPLSDLFNPIVIGVVKGSRADSMRDAFKFLYQNWTVGVQLTLPIGNILSRSDYTRARMELEKSQAQLKAQERSIRLEVSDAVRNIQTGAKQVEAYRVARELAEKRLEAEMKKMSVGLSTNFFVLDAQEKLAAARSQEIQSLVNYRKATAQLQRVTGTSLRSRNIDIDNLGGGGKRP